MYFTSIKSGSISFVLTLYFALPCIGQVTQLNRYELILGEQPSSDNPQIASLGKEGILIYRRINGKTNDQFELIKMDTTLRENWRGYIAIEKNIAVSKMVTHDQMIYMLFRSVTYGNFDFNVITMNIHNRGYSSHLVKNLIPFTPTDFNVSTNAILISGYFNYRPVVLHFSFASGRSRLLPGFFNDQGELNQIKTHDNGLIDIIASTRNMQRKKVLWLRSYTPEGDLIQANVIEGDLDKNLIFGKSLRKPDGTQFIAGNFGIRNVEFSRGIFIAQLKPDGEYTIRYHNFSDFENFFKFMRPRRESRVMERINKRKQMGKKNRQSYRFLTQEFHQYGNEYLLLGEAFYPRYTYLSPYGYFGNSLFRGDRIFDGYHYTHASIIGLDEAGNLIWDNAFEMNDIKTFTLSQYVKLAPKSDHLGMLYLFGNVVHSKTIHYNQVLEGKLEKELESKFDTDIIKEKNTRSGVLEYWYQPYFYAYGIQYVRDSEDRNNDGSRKVLFINKLKFQ